MGHSDSGWTRGVQVKLWDPLKTRAIPERLRGVFMTRRYTNPRLPLPWLRLKGSTEAVMYLTTHKVSNNHRQLTHPVSNAKTMQHSTPYTIINILSSASFSAGLAWRQALKTIFKKTRITKSLPSQSYNDSSEATHAAWCMGSRDFKPVMH